MMSQGYLSDVAAEVYSGLAALDDHGGITCEGAWGYAIGVMRMDPAGYTLDESIVVADDVCRRLRKEKPSGQLVEKWILAYIRRKNGRSDS